MKLRRQIISFGFLLAILAAGGILRAQDHPLIKPYPGSSGGITRESQFDEYDLPLGPTDAQGKFAKSEPLEGRVTALSYTFPRERSVLEVYRNYEAALKQAGFQILFACKAAECGKAKGEVKDLGAIYPYSYPEFRYLAAKLSRPDGDVYVGLMIPQVPSSKMVVIEVKPMDTGMVAVNAAALASDIGKQGHVAIYGIFFDTGKADVKPESEPTLVEIAKLLQQDAQLRLFVIGHTDITGDLAMNMDLSRRRANAVVQVLTTKHSIAAARLKADGVGPYAPVASNDAEEGRAKNRRVELVKQ